ncbi:pyrimidine-nucleoside phosphorylase [Halonatronum saccharophilum]|uniref:pyrimidine-nucleoside phosphorylase n=1 Tax=Halonatronum saccharophilum TaxID=150060 RepID=UPI000484BB77|nr:pyrimidine-nucleoside phosphorylase [Halonatronum saccharophilum]
MRVYDIIYKKREGKKLSKEEIDFLIEGYTKGEIPDYQMSSWAMAVFFKGMDREEIGNLTEAMVDSGDRIDLSPIEGVKVDKHSTGGVGDTTTLVLAPLVAACGAPVAKMSGRGLGHTGGTLDKLEAISGFNISLTREDFINNVNENKIAVAGQTGDLAPADKKLYALRDVTATVDSIPLIASSIMSKKIASGADSIVLDVKTGNGAFMKEYEGSVQLAKTMVEIGKEVGRRTVAVVSDMDQPLGFAVGNSLEVEEAILTLKGEGPADLTELSLTLGSHMLVLSGVTKDADEGREILERAISDGSGLAKFKEMANIQGGNGEVIDNIDLLPKAKNNLEVRSKKEGYVQKIVAEDVGISAMLLGAGRETKESEIDLAAGIKLAKKVGDKVDSGETIATLYYNESAKVDEAKDKLLGAYQIGDKKPALNPLIYEVIK